MQSGYNDVSGVPDVDDQGRLVILERERTKMTNMFFAVFCTAVTLISVWYWFEWFHNGLSPIEQTIFHLPGYVGPFFAPVAGLFILAFLAPRKLVIDSDKVEHYNLGRSNQLMWRDIKDIFGQSNIAWVGQPGPQIRRETTIFIVGIDRKIVLPAVFQVTQDELLACLKTAWARNK